MMLGPQARSSLTACRYLFLILIRTSNSEHHMMDTTRVQRPVRMRPVGDVAKVLVADMYAHVLPPSVSAGSFGVSFGAVVFAKSPLTKDPSCKERAVETSDPSDDSIDSMILGLRIERAARLDEAVSSDNQILCFLTCPQVHGPHRCPLALPARAFPAGEV